MEYFSFKSEYLFFQLYFQKNRFSIWKIFWYAKIVKGISNFAATEYIFCESIFYLYIFSSVWFGFKEQKTIGMSIFFNEEKKNLYIGNMLGVRENI